jgi:hypothetical protein
MYHDLKATYWWYGMKRHCRVCCPLRHLSVSQSRASTTCWIAIAEESKPSINDTCSLYTYQYHLLWTTTSRVVYVKDSLFAWSAVEDCV